MLRKITILLVCLLLLSFASVGHAKIEKKYDDFKGYTTIISKQDYVGPWDLFMFFKGVGYESSGNATYMFAPYMVDKEWWFFSEKDAEIKINGKIYPLRVIDTDSKILSARALRTSASIVVPPEVIALISKDADIILRVYSRNRGYVTWTVPPSVLEEWEKVINM